MLSILASFAQEESRSISDNVKWGTRKRMEQGIPNGHFRVYGYRWEGDVLVPIPEEAAMVKRTFQNFLDGKSRLETEREFAAEGITTREGCRWVDSNIKVVLSNVTYTGNLLLQKEYIADPLTKKRKKNRGELPQYYLEGTHEAIIEPDLFDRVQDMIQQRDLQGGYSGLTIFSSKIVCGECGSWYGSKVWHSTDQYRRVIWQCNAKFKQKKHCRTPHLTEDEVKAAFLRMMNRLTTDRDMILEGMREDQAMLTGTEDLERQQKQLAEQMNVDADAVQELIAQNARVAQDQAEYNVRYEALSTRFNETKAKYDTVTAQIAQLGIRRRELGRFIRQVEELPETITKFDEALWGSMVDHLTVHSKDNIVFTLTGGMEIKA